MLFLAAALVLAAGASAEDMPELAVCQVCAVNGVNGAPQKVAAASMVDGVTYYFCTKKCQRAFNADPFSYIVPPFPWPAPRATVKRLDGMQVALDGPRPKLMLVNFWRASGCIPCEQTMPDFERILRARGFKGLTVLGVSLDSDRNAIESYLRDRKLTYPVAMDVGEEPAWIAFRVKSVPTSFLIDRRGQVVGRWAGRPNMAHVLATVDSVLAAPTER